MSEIKLQELTFGTFGMMMWKNCFSVKLTEQELIIRSPLKKVIIPRQYIDGLTSHTRIRYGLGISFAGGGKYLKVIHHYPKAPKNIFFLTSSNENAWLEAFNKK